MTLRLSGGRRLQSPPGDTARPTAARVRQAVLNLLAPQLPGCRWLDLCCGSGVMACEALQRGAAEVVAIERDRRVAAVARANLEAVASSLGSGDQRPRLRVIQAEAGRWLAAHAPAAVQGRADKQLNAHEAQGLDCSPEGGAAPDRDRDAQGQGDAAVRGKAEPSVTQVREQAFDLIYLDPPWPAGLHGPLSEAVARGGWIVPGGTLVWECPSDAVPEAPAGWRLRDQRRYGGSTVVLLEPL